MTREQEQFLNVVDRDVAERRWWDVIQPSRLAEASVPLGDALGRVLARDVTARVDVPAFDRSNVDGYALRAEDVYRASDEAPILLQINPEPIATGQVPRMIVAGGTATPIATGGMLPRGADAVVMVEHTRVEIDALWVVRAVAPGANLSFAGTDMAQGELVLRRGTVLTARETGVLAAIGNDPVAVVRRPRVAIISTGDEIIAPSDAPRPAAVFDANATLLADSVRELGGEPVPLGIVPDDAARLDQVLDHALEIADVVLLSGGTSKGEGDLSYQALRSRSPGIAVHGVALKPGKPICLGAVGSKPVAILPGFPTSAVFTFHEFVAPVIRHLGGRGPSALDSLPARMAMRANSDPGRTEYLLVNLVKAPEGWSAYPMGKGSGSVTTFSRADGFVVIPRRQEFLAADEPVAVNLLGRGVEPADLVVIGSHCVGLDALLGLLAARGFRSKTFWAGSQGGLAAAARRECDIAGFHLLDPESGQYNLPFLPEGARFVRGYNRMQGIVFRPGDARFSDHAADDAVEMALDDPACLMVNRNRGSGTRVLLDGLLKGRKAPGSSVEVRSHNAVAASVCQGRADWGVAIAPVACQYGLGFIPLRVEQYDFAIPAERWDRPAVAAFRVLLAEPESRRLLESLGFMTVDIS